MVTVSTNMAGRGTDILLGGNPDFMTKEVCLKDKLAERLPAGVEAFGTGGKAYSGSTEVSGGERSG